MKNWNSKTNLYYDIVGEEIKEKARIALSMKDNGVPVSVIAKGLGLSKSRIYQYLRDE
jgi:predicted transcriptional regulator